MSASLPAPGYALRAAFDLAWRRLSESNLAIVARRSASQESHGEIRLNYLGNEIVLTPAAHQLRGPSLSEREKLVVLHYLLTADGTVPAERPVSFSEIPGAAGYSEPFRGRVVRRLLKKFGANPETLLARGRELGWQVGHFGDASVIAPAFPRVQVTLVLWSGDSELAPEGTVLFDANIRHYLDVEDVVVLCEEILRRL